jgi:hypothetical protein
MTALTRLGPLALALAGFASTTTIALPRSAPHGNVEISSLGIASLVPDDGPPIATLHVRMAIANTNDTVAWALDGQNAWLDIPGETRTSALFLNSDLATLPLAIIDPGQRQVIDFYFPVPAYVTTEHDLATFDVAWRVGTSAGNYETRTLFLRDQRPDATGPTDLAFGWGRYWWADPKYPWASYYHRPGFAVPRPPQHVTIQRPRYGH